MENFTYHRPHHATDAVKLMKGAKDGKFMSGGMTLLPAIKHGLAQPSDIIDLGGLKHPHVRNRGTIGGSIANADPAADYPAAVVGLGATVHTDQRKIAGDKFFTGMFETALKPDEIVTAVEFQVPKRSAYVKFPNPASLYAMVGVYVAELADGSVRVAVTGAGPSVFRVPEMEKALEKSFTADAISGVKVNEGDLNNDIHASSAYRAHLVNVLARRAVEQAK
jgi:carbon-monoxide dehydrogenase medium subunit